MEASNEIDTRLAGLGVTLPFTTNPPVLQDWCVLYARYACLRDLYTSGDPQGPQPGKAYLDSFESKWLEFKTGWKQLLDSSGTAVTASKFTPLTDDYPSSEVQSKDLYPQYPLGPYPDPPTVDEE
jgi:hypothetical protein